MAATPCKVLLAIGDPWLRAALASALRTEALVPRTAADGYAAWAAFLAEGAELEVLVADLALPGLSGLALVRRLRRERPGLRALLLADELPDRLRDALADEEIAAARLPAPLAHLALRVEIASRSTAGALAASLRTAV